MDLMHFLNTEFRRRRYNIDKASIEQYAVCVNLLSRFIGRPVQLSDLSDELLQSWLVALKDSGRSPRTINNKRCSIITLWREAKECRLVTVAAPDSRRVRRLKIPRRNPTAWRLDELRKLFDACEFGPKHQGWDGRHWKALVLVCYDTGERLNAILQAPLRNLDREQLCLYVPAELRKGQTEDKFHRLHKATVTAIEEIIQPGQESLIPWPVSRRSIWPEFKQILRHAGLPATRRDLFHKLRRTGYTYLWCSQGPHAASEFAGHHEDLSRYYLDRTFLPKLDPLDALPRPV